MFALMADHRQAQINLHREIADDCLKRREEVLLMTTPCYPKRGLLPETILHTR